MKHVILKPKKEKPLLNRHHWIFSGAIASLPEFTDGEILPVYSHEGKMLGSAYFNRRAKIIGRMLSFDAVPVETTILHNLEAAFAMRDSLFDRNTTAFRLVNAEGDFLPGLVIDKYADVYVIQLSTLGMELLKPLVINYIEKNYAPRAIYEKSTSPSRKEEGLTEHQEHLYGSLPEELVVSEHGLSFFVSPAEGQKTGFFLDHREMRKRIGELSQGKRVLNAFCYTGGFSVYALAGGAKRVVSVDISDKAIQLCRKNVALNRLNEGIHQTHTADVFQFLRDSPCEEDLVILDPPAFAKKQKDIIPACRGYKDLNRIAMQKMPKGSLLLTCSCSYFVDEPLFQKVLFQAAVEANRKVRILEKHRLAADHPINICHPEGNYLKSFLLYLE